MKKVRRQPDTRLKDIQDAVHEKYMVDISAGKASRARGKAQEAVDGAPLHSSTNCGSTVIS